MSEIDPDVKRILESPSYELAERDTALLARSELRPVRLQLEFLKPELAFGERNITQTIVVFGSTRILDRPLLEEKRRQITAALAADPANQSLGASWPAPSDCWRSILIMKRRASLPGWWPCGGPPAARVTWW